MNAEGLEKIVARHEMQCFELKESVNAECIESPCAFTNAANVMGIASPMSGTVVKTSVRSRWQGVV